MSDEKAPEPDDIVAGEPEVFRGTMPPESITGELPAEPNRVALLTVQKSLNFNVVKYRVDVTNPQAPQLLYCWFMAKDSEHAGPWVQKIGALEERWYGGRLEASVTADELAVLRASGSPLVNAWRFKLGPINSSSLFLVHRQLRLTSGVRDMWKIEGLYKGMAKSMQLKRMYLVQSSQVMVDTVLLDFQDSGTAFPMCIRVSTKPTKS